MFVAIDMKLKDDSEKRREFWNTDRDIGVNKRIFNVARAKCKIMHNVSIYPNK